MSANSLFIKLLSHTQVHQVEKPCGPGSWCLAAVLSLFPGRASDSGCRSSSVLQWEVEGAGRDVACYEGGLHMLPEEWRAVILARNKNGNKCIPVGLLFFLGGGKGCYKSPERSFSCRRCTLFLLQLKRKQIASLVTVSLETTKLQFLLTSGGTKGALEPSHSFQSACTLHVV